MGLGDRPGTYTGDREARRKRIKDRGHAGVLDKALEAARSPGPTPRCKTCADHGFVYGRREGVIDPTIRRTCHACGGQPA